VLAVNADYQSGTATVGTQPGTDVPTDKILTAIESIGYHAQVSAAAETRAQQESLPYRREVAR
jgi:hypothetical protein